MRLTRIRGLARRRPVRLRLTLVYTSLFLLAGAGVLTVSYVLVEQSPGLSQPDLQSSQKAQFMSAAIKACVAKAATSAQGGLCKQLAEQDAAKLAKAGATAQQAQTLHHLLFYSFAALALMALISAVLGWVVAGRALRPVHAITAAARRASDENLGDRIALAGPHDELKELADTFDAMLSRLDAAFASQRRFVANASHELRTPLAVIRTSIDVTLAKPGRTPAQLEAMAIEVRQAADRAEVLIEALLTLARSDRGRGPRELLDMAVLAEDALEAAAPAMAARPVTVETALEPGPTPGDPVLIGRLVTNLVDNAVRHNVAGGWIHVVTGTRDGMAFLDVANSGDAIPADLAPALFEPFRRLGGRMAGPDGAGLGLSIVQSVAAAHRGRVSVWPLPAGGLRVLVLLPRA
jgi:signal transduction histidine kinase